MITLKYIINSVDRSIIYDKLILGNVAIYVFFPLLILSEHEALILFASMYQIKLLLLNYLAALTCEPEYEKPI